MKENIKNFCTENEDFTYRVVNPITFKNWNDHVGALQQTSVFYSSFWAQVLQQSYGYSPMYITNFEKERLNFLLPLMIINSRLTGRRVVSLPFTDYCDPISFNQNVFTNVLLKIIAFGQSSGWKQLEFRGGSKLFQSSKSSLQYFHHQLSLSDDSTLLSKFKSNTKRNIRKAEREGVQVKIENSSEAMDNFYRLNCYTRKKHGLPPQPKKFFNNVYEIIIKNNHGSIVNAFKNHQPLASAIYFHFKDTVVYKYGASDEIYLKLRANNLVMWEAIKHYAKNGFKIFDFGKTEISNEGLCRFKRGWGTHEKIISYFKYDFGCNSFIREKNKESGWYNYIFKKMPLPLLKATGALLYKHVG